MPKITIIGGGPGGYTAAFAAARAGCEVTLIEKHRLGGTCLNTGCVPTKTLKATADALETAQSLAAYGITLSAPATASVDMPAVLARKNKVIATLVGGLSKSCAKYKITHLEGVGRIVNAHCVQVQTASEEIMVEGDAIIIATGSKVRELPTFPFDGTHIIHSDHILERENLPKHMIVVGGGVVGCEMAFIYSAFGVSITLVEGQKRVLPIAGVDAEISTLIQREMKKRRIAVHLGSTLGDVCVEDGKVKAQIEPLIQAGQCPDPKCKITPVECDAVLVTVGRSAATEGLDLSAAGITTDAQGWITVDEHLRTSVPGIYAIGDVLGPQYIMLAHMAAAEGVHAVRHILAEDATQMAPMDYSVVPSAIFTSPEVGCVGLSEEQAKEQGIHTTCAHFLLRELGKAQASGHLAGMIKLVAEAESGRLLGAHMAGEHMSDIIAEAALCMRKGGTIQDIANTIHAHPTLAEGVFEAACELYPSEF